jgi:hypothetical protein
MRTGKLARILIALATAAAAARLYSWLRARRTRCAQCGRLLESPRLRVCASCFLYNRW